MPAVVPTRSYARAWPERTRDRHAAALSRVIRISLPRWAGEGSVGGRSSADRALRPPTSALPRKRGRGFVCSTFERDDLLRLRAQAIDAELHHVAALEKHRLRF